MESLRLRRFVLTLGAACMARAEELCALNPLACGGSRGSCHTTRGVDICECSGTSTERYFGRRCEGTIAVGAPCAAGCSGHGECVHGWCECAAGWSGELCDTPSWGEGDAQPFLTRRALLEVVGEDGECAPPASGAEPALACCEPTALYRRAVYRRNASEARALLDSLPPQLEPAAGWPARPRHASCAVVSSASSLLEAEHGAQIDEHEAVFRINRAPTAGFERHVGVRTTYDWLNSGPHTTSVYAEAILPRVPLPVDAPGASTTLLHGTTTAPVERGSYSRVLEWVEGHVRYARYHPAKAAARTRLVSLEFLHASWDAFGAYAAPFLPGSARGVRPSSGWHTARLALALCERVTLYGFSLDSAVGNTKFHYFDSLVQATISEAMKDPLAPGTHKFRLEHLIYANWTRHGPLSGRVRLVT